MLVQRDGNWVPEYFLCHEEELRQECLRIMPGNFSQDLQEMLCSMNIAVAPDNETSYRFVEEQGLYFVIVEKGGAKIKIGFEVKFQLIGG